jgi:hypothetical protein
LRAGVLKINEKSLVIIKNCIFELNFGDYGAILNLQDFASLKIINSSFVKNTCSANIFDIIDSNFEIENSTFSENRNNLFLISQSNLNFYRISISHHLCEIFSEGCILYIYDDSKINISNTNLNNITTSIEGNIFIVNSNLNIIMSSLTFVSSLSSKGSCIFSIDSRILIQQSRFKKFFDNALYIEKGLISINYSSFEENDGLSYKRTNSAIICINCNQFNLNNCIIRKNMNLQTGGGLKLISTDIFSNFFPNLISNCSFSINKVFKEGGAIFIQNQNIILKNSVFESNSANSGAGIYCLIEG